MKTQLINTVSPSVTIDFTPTAPLSGYGYKVVCYFHDWKAQNPKTHVLPTGCAINLGVFATYSEAQEAVRPHKAHPHYLGHFMSEEGYHA